MADYLGDFTIGKTVQHKFMTVNASGVPTTLGNSPTLLVYANASVSGVASGTTLTVDFDANTGLNHVSFLATSSVTGVTSGAEYQIVIATGSVSGVSMKGWPICDFSLMNRSAVRPTVADRSLDVSSTGEAGVDWANVGGQGTTVALTATTLFTTTNVTNTVPANVTAYSTAIAANVTAASTNIGAVITASSINIGAVVTAVNTVVPANVTAASTNIGAIVTAFNTIAAANVTSISTNVGAIVTAFNTIANANVTSISTIVNASVTGINVASVSAIGSGVWDVTIASHLNAGSTGAALNAAGSAGDPWITALPGAYGAGSAGFILGATIQAAVTAINAKTAQLNFTVAGQVDANAESMNATTILGAGVAGNLWRG